MLISYVLFFIFALISSVVAPPPPSPQWKKLQGTKDGAFTNNFRWYRVKKLELGDKLLSWPEDKLLDQAFQLTSIDEAAQGIRIYKFHRELVEKDGRDEYEFRGLSNAPDEQSLSDPQIDLKGLWARSIKNPKAPVRGGLAFAPPVIAAGDVIEIEIEKRSQSWIYRPVGEGGYTFSSALMSYPLSKEEAMKIKEKHTGGA